jgi:hypothetical protein
MTMSEEQYVLAKSIEDQISFWAPLFFVNPPRPLIKSNPKLKLKNDEGKLLGISRRQRRADT